MGIMGLAGCGFWGEKHTDEEWNQLLIDALEPLEHVAELTNFSYEMKGVLGAKTTAWIAGTVRSDTDDVATNEALRDQVGKTLATVHLNNPNRKSWVMVYVGSPSSRAYEFRDAEQRIVGLDELAEFYGVER